MSDPRRYIAKAVIVPVKEDNTYDIEAIQDPNGDWVAWEDYANIKAEVESLKEGNEYLGQMHDKEMERSAYLCEQVERLRKELADAQENYHIVNEMVAKMLKEGKQS